MISTVWSRDREDSPGVEEVHCVQKENIYTVFRKITPTFVFLHNS